MFAGIFAPDGVIDALAGGPVLAVDPPGSLAHVSEPEGADRAGRPVVHRRAGRVLVVDPAGRVLLLHGYDPARRDEPYWFTVGGGAKPGESLADAAARELREEAGIAVAAADLGAPVWHEVTEFSFDGRQYRQEQDFFLLRVRVPDVTTDGMTEEEAAVVDGHRWWTVVELDSTAESVYPAVLPQLLRRLVV